VGTEDDLVNRRAQTDAFLLKLKQANFFVRTCIVQGAPHYWLSDPIEEPASYSGFLAPRLMRFLQERRRAVLELRQARIEGGVNRDTDGERVGWVLRRKAHPTGCLTS